LINRAQNVDGFKLVIGEFSVAKADDLKIADKLREKLKWRWFALFSY
jgi:hypothetical protein